jgi:uncharacterized membrane protein YfcA
MSTHTIIILLTIGLLAGFLSGTVGVGGGVIIVPMLVYLLGFEQHKAQGTSLFMFLFPIGILGVMNYYKKGFVDIKTALVICTTFILGSFLGSKFSLSLDQNVVKRIFGGVFMLVALKMLFGK